MITPSISRARPWPYGGRAAPASPLAAVTGLVAGIHRRYRAGRAVQELQGFDDRMLRDIGLGRGEIERAVRAGRSPA